MNDTKAPATDRELVLRALGQHQPSYSELMARHREAVFRIARHHTGDEGEAMDVTQEVFISAFASLNKFDPDRPLPRMAGAHRDQQVSRLGAAAGGAPPVPHGQAAG